MPLCYYAECPGITSCHLVPHANAWMRGRGSACLHPCQAEHYSSVSLRRDAKERWVCRSCQEWLCSNECPERAFLLQQLQRVPSKRKPCSRPYTAWSVVDAPWAVHTLDASVVVLSGSGIEESHDVYYVADCKMSGCKQAGVQRVWMTGKNVSQKNRLSGIPCATWLREEHRAEVMSLCASCRRSFCWSHLMLICRGDRM
jgi:hypothetical protein